MTKPTFARCIRRIHRMPSACVSSSPMIARLDIGHHEALRLFRSGTSHRLRISLKLKGLADGERYGMHRRAHRPGEPRPRTCIPRLHSRT